MLFILGGIFDGVSNRIGAMNAKTLYDKLWESHVVREEADGTVLLYIDRHLVHEVTSPQAFEGLRLAHRQPWRVEANLATPDHNVPTTDRNKEIEDPVSRLQVETLDRNCDDFGITEFRMDDIRQGIVHVVGPEQGATLPGMTVVCGDSHTSTHGAFGALAHGMRTLLDDVDATRAMGARARERVAGIRWPQTLAALLAHLETLSPARIRLAWPALATNTGVCSRLPARRRRSCSSSASRNEP